MPGDEQFGGRSTIQDRLDGRTGMAVEGAPMPGGDDYYYYSYYHHYGDTCIVRLILRMMIF